ncbi:MAG: right-handed parallel beta-helix repeat-containing protein, partial [bacterium]|nr:right-handed parallel beta-helix repeat-containing protein [bacterium]
VWHDVSLEGCTISGMTQAGVLRVGRDGRNRGGPYRFVGCTFEGNLVGIEFRRPCLDSGIVIKGSRFLANEQFGLRLTGQLGNGAADGTADGDRVAQVDPEVRGNLIQDCLFRWNGVGAHVTSSQQPLFVSRSSFRNNRGNGLYIANFLTDPTAVSVGNSLFAKNGSHGIYSLADGRLQSVSIRSCTVVDNDAGGIRDHRRHSGSSNFALVGSIIAGNGDGNDLADMDPELARYCLVGKLTADPEARAAFARAGNLTDRTPRFLDRTL